MAPRATAQKNVETTTVGTTDRIVNGIKLESIPLPDSAVGARSKYPFADMKVGESFEIIGDKMLQNIRNAAGKFATNHKEYRFATRTTGERVVDGQTVKVYRCWRIEVKVNG
jgi:hypothetical protein